MSWLGQDYVVRYIIRESERVIFRSRVRRRLLYGLLLTEISIGAWNVAFVHSLWMNVPMALIVGLIFLMFLTARSDVRKAQWLRKRVRDL